MHLVRSISAAALFLFLGTMAAAYAQHDQKDENPGKPQERDKQQTAPRAAQQPRRQGNPQPQREQQQPRQPQAQREQQQPRQPQAQREQRQPRQPQLQQQRAQQAPQAQTQQLAQRSQPAQQQLPNRTRQQAVAWQQQRGWAQQGAWQEHSTWQQGRARRWETDHRTWAQRGGYGGYFIPQATFSLSFGSQHWFRMHSRPVMYMGYPRFSYGGFSFMLVDPWPEYWAENWYDMDDVYIDYDGGYYLYNRRYPGIGLAVAIVM